MQRILCQKRFKILKRELFYIPDIEQKCLAYWNNFALIIDDSLIKPIVVEDRCSLLWSVTGINTYKRDRCLINWLNSKVVSLYETLLRLKDSMSGKSCAIHSEALFSYTGTR
jgi:hypothetical protein